MKHHILQILKNQEHCKCHFDGKPISLGNKFDIGLGYGCGVKNLSSDSGDQGLQSGLKD